MCPPDAHPVARHQVVVIGGGIAGLTAVKVCQDHGIDAHAFERENTLGGVWNHTYKNVRLQQHKDDFRLSGTEWPANVKDFPDAKAVQGYVAKFVHEHNLACKVTSGVEVISAERDEAADEWHVVLSDGRKARSKHLIVATGALGKPKQSEAAAIFENFSGEVLHSSEYYDAERFHGKDVLILGGGSSAIEIAVDLARAADSTTMSVRSNVDWVFPRHGMFGQSLRLCGAGGSAPLWLRNAAARLTFALKFGALEDYGMRPAGAPLDRRIVVSDEFYPLVKHGAIQINRGGVKSVVADEVTFADGSKRRYDAVVLCTGYEVATRSTSHPYLKKHLEEDVKLDFYLGCFLPDVPNCSFIGGCFGFAAVPRIAELQAKAAVNVISGVSPLPSPETMRRRVKRVLGFHVQKVRRSRIGIAREISRVSNLRPISVSRARAARRGRITRHPSLPPDAGESQPWFSAAAAERTTTRRERARRTPLPPLQVLVPDIDRAASISPPSRAENENELAPLRSSPALATERSSPVPPRIPEG